MSAVRSIAALMLSLASGACVAIDRMPPASPQRVIGPADYTVFWDLPETGWYWVPKGTSAYLIIEAGKACNAIVDGAMFHHIPVPPKYDYLGFHFVGSNPDSAKQCVIDRVGAAPALTVYPKKK